MRSLILLIFWFTLQMVAKLNNITLDARYEPAIWMIFGLFLLMDIGEMILRRTK